jgi:hypothetical protein
MGRYGGIRGNIRHYAGKHTRILIESSILRLGNPESRQFHLTFRTYQYILRTDIAMSDPPTMREYEGLSQSDRAVRCGSKLKRRGASNPFLEIDATYILLRDKDSDPILFVGTDIESAGNARVTEGKNLAKSAAQFLRDCGMLRRPLGEQNLQGDDAVLRTITRPVCG